MVRPSYEINKRTLSSQSSGSTQSTGRIVDGRTNNNTSQNASKTLWRDSKAKYEKQHSKSKATEGQETKASSLSSSDTTPNGNPHTDDSSSSSNPYQRVDALSSNNSGRLNETSNMPQQRRLKSQNVLRTFQNPGTLIHSPPYNNHANLRSPYSITTTTTATTATTATASAMDEGTVSLSSADYSADRGYYPNDSLDEFLPLLSQDEDDEDGVEDQHDMDIYHSLPASTSNDSSCLTVPVDNTSPPVSSVINKEEASAVTKTKSTKKKSPTTKKSKSSPIPLESSKSRKKKAELIVVQGSSAKSLSSLSSSSTSPFKTKKVKLKLKRSISSPTRSAAFAMKKAPLMLQNSSSSSLGSKSSSKSTSNSPLASSKTPSKQKSEKDLNQNDAQQFSNVRYSPPREAKGETYVFDQVPTVETFDPVTIPLHSSFDLDENDTFDHVNRPNPRRLRQNMSETLHSISSPPRRPRNTQRVGRVQLTPPSTVSSSESETDIIHDSGGGPYSTLLNNFMDLERHSLSTVYSSSANSEKAPSSSSSEVKQSLQSLNGDSLNEESVTEDDETSIGEHGPSYRRFVLRNLSEACIQNDEFDKKNGLKETYIPHFHITVPPEVDKGTHVIPVECDTDVDQTEGGTDLDQIENGADVEQCGTNIEESFGDFKGKEEEDLQALLSLPPPPPPPPSSGSPVKHTRQDSLAFQSDLLPLPSLVKHDRQLSAIEEEHWAQISNNSLSPMSPAQRKRKSSSRDNFDIGSGSIYSPENPWWKSPLHRHQMENKSFFPLSEEELIQIDECPEPDSSAAPANAANERLISDNVTDRAEDSARQPPSPPETSDNRSEIIPPTTESQASLPESITMPVDEQDEAVSLLNDFVLERHKPVVMMTQSFGIEAYQDSPSRAKSRNDESDKLKDVGSTDDMDYHPAPPQAKALHLDTSDVFSDDEHRSVDKSNTPLVPINRQSSRRWRTWHVLRCIFEISGAGVLIHHLKNSHCPENECLQLEFWIQIYESSREKVLVAVSYYSEELFWRIFDSTNALSQFFSNYQQKWTSKILVLSDAMTEWEISFKTLASTAMDKANNLTLSDRISLTPKVVTDRISLTPNVALTSNEVIVRPSLLDVFKDLWMEFSSNYSVYGKLIWTFLRQPGSWVIVVLFLFLVHFIIKCIVGPFCSTMWSLFARGLRRKRQLTTAMPTSVSFIKEESTPIPPSPQPMHTTNDSTVAAMPPTELGRKDSWLTKLYNVVNSGSNLSSAFSFHRFQSYESGSDVLFDHSRDLSSTCMLYSGDDYTSNVHNDDCSTVGSVSLSPPKMLRNYFNASSARGTDAQNDYYNRFASRSVIDEYDPVPTNRSVQPDLAMPLQDDDANSKTTTTLAPRYKDTGASPLRKGPVEPILKEKISSSSMGSNANNKELSVTVPDAATKPKKGLKLWNPLGSPGGDKSKVRDDDQSVTSTATSNSKKLSQALRAAFAPKHGSASKRSSSPSLSLPLKRSATTSSASVADQQSNTQMAPAPLLRKSNSSTTLSSRPSLANFNNRGSDRSGLSVSFSKRNNETVLYEIDRPPSALDGASSSSNLRGTRSLNSSPLNIGGVLFNDNNNGVANLPRPDATLPTLPSKSTKESLLPPEADVDLDEDEPRQFYGSHEHAQRDLNVADRPKPNAIHARTKTMAASIPLNEPLANSNSELSFHDSFGHTDSSNNIVDNSNNDGIHPLYRRSPSPPDPDLPKPVNARTFTAPVDMFNNNVFKRGESLVDEGADTGGDMNRISSSLLKNQNEGSNRSIRSGLLQDSSLQQRGKGRVPVLRPELLITDSYDSDEETLVEDLDEESYVALMDVEQLNRAISLDIESMAPTSVPSIPSSPGTSIRQHFANANRRSRPGSPASISRGGLHDDDDNGDFPQSLRGMIDHLRSMKQLPNESMSFRTYGGDLTAEQVAKRNELTRKKLSLFFMKSLHGLPTGIAKQCYKLQEKFPLRIWLVDNSGSMLTGDGKRFFHGKGKVKQMLHCRRWDELADAVSNHAALAKDLGSPMIFRLLNDPNLGRDDLKEHLPQVLGICARKKYALEEVADQVNAAATLLSAASTMNSFKKSIEAARTGAASHATGSDSKVGGGGDTASLSTNPTGASSKWSLFKSNFYQDKKLADAKATLQNVATTQKDLKRRAVTGPERSWEGVWEIDVGQKDNRRDLQWMDRAQKDLELLRKVMEAAEPRYKTPLAGHMVAIHDQVKGMLPSLKEHRQKVVVVIATDGIPTDRDVFLGAIHMLQKMPVKFIVRLCTDDEAAIHFWMTLELDFRRLDIEIVDDFEAEAEAVASMNPWFTYAMPLQRAREFGFRHPLITRLKERPLTHDELRDFCALFFGVSSNVLPHPKEDWETFYTDIEALLTRESRQWNPVFRSTKPWIRIGEMAKQYGGKREKFRLQREEMLQEVEEAAQDHAECCNPSSSDDNARSNAMGDSRRNLAGPNGVNANASFRENNTTTVVGTSNCTILGCSCIIL